MNFNPFEYLRDSRSMDDSLDRESTKGADDSDRKPFSKLEEESVDPLDCLEGNTSMIDSKDGENTKGADDSDKNPSLSWTSLGEEGVNEAEYSGQDDEVNIFAGLDRIKEEGTSSDRWERERNRY